MPMPLRRSDMNSHTETLTMIALVAAMTLGGQLGYCGSDATSQDGQRIDKLSFEGKSLREAIRNLCRTFARPICLEESPIFSKQRLSREEVHTRMQAKSAGVDVTVTNALLDEVLDARCKFDDQYEWTHDRNTAFINVFPKSNAPMSWVIGDLAIANMTIRRVLASDVLELREHRILPDPQSGKLTWLDSKVSLVATNIPVREALNRLCAQTDPALRWEVFDPLRTGTGCLSLWFYPLASEQGP